MIMETDVFNGVLLGLDSKKLAFIIMALVTAGHVSQHIVEKAIDLADTIKT